MWNITLTNQLIQPLLPPFKTQSLLFLGIILLLFRIAIQQMLLHCFGVQFIKKQHNSSSLQFSYFYHLSLIILCFEQLNWNLFDLCFWVFAYICVGMVRNAIYIINAQRQLLINDYAYSNKIVKFLLNSIKLAIITLPLSIISIISINLSFIGTIHKVISILCFPLLMLVLDSIFLLATSWQIQKHLVYFYNQNISGISPVYRLDFYYKIATCAVKFSHFFNLIVLSLSIIVQKIDVIACVWVFSIFSAFSQSISGMIRSISKYRSMKKLTKSVNQILTKVKKSSDQICVICMQPLLNSYRLVQCGHLFHYKCLLQWLQTKQQCPVCRVRINLNL